MMTVQPTVEQVRAFAQDHGLKPATMARKAGLHPNTLRGLFDPGWNPRADTLQKVAAAINAGVMTPPAPHTGIANSADVTVVPGDQEAA